MNAPITREPAGSNKAWVERRSKAVSRGIGMGAAVMAERAENSEIWDIEGNRYVDFGGGIAVVNTGHRHPLVMKRVYEQLEKVTHTCAMVMPYAPFIEVCEKLNAVAPISGEKKSALVTTGAEAVENAIKYARAYTGRSDVIAFHGGFHGRTLLGMALTGKVQPYKAKFGPMPAGIWHVPFPVEHRGITVEDSIHAIELLFKCDVEPQRVAAIIIEPVQGEGGFYVAPKELMQRLRKLCDEHGILLIADEIQSGFGRTGKFFAMEHFGVEPDLMTAAKSLAGGFPLAAVVGKAAIMDAPDPGGIGGTYAGNAIACAAALGVFEAFETEDLLNKALKQGETIMKRLKAIKAKGKGMPMGDIRGLGAMCAFEVVTKQDSDEPDAAGTKALVAKCLERGLLILSCGVYANTIRLLTPLTASDLVLNEGLDILEAAITGN
ncbi:4-aminobutyrate--2-oxoglutarate transaminase [Aestuariivirga litoralis]|uniref:4-aminobutyrate--2-oxoglutarate transaminase n=1 Tax=Aestuariivirga litoralis TaxID=2650924 RepID=UPI0018C7C855|nr:4-aminobutyrate--2-oxoglutarate transaminase [Aestuariivirga litoralis]MBG1233293.1 4-aminobutyrate--2-oxoglutarate transaminase [Aestuariivirga litoralis]